MIAVVGGLVFDRWFWPIIQPLLTETTEHPRQIHLFRVVVPIFRLLEDGGWGSFAGTGTFVGDPPLLATAYHVVRGAGTEFAIALPPSPIRWNINAFPATLILLDSDVDLALLRVKGYVPPFTFVLARDNEIVNNIPVLSYEFGTTQRYAGIDHLAPATRMGNVTRVIDLSDRFGPAGRHALELSYPALRGASGAPVLSSVNTHLWGIVIANYEYHLLPAQIATTVDQHEGIHEEVMYLLPQAIAVNAVHLRPLLLAEQGAAA